MDRTGARAELISELRRIGPRYTDAAEALGLTIRFMQELPGLYLVNARNGLVVTNDSDDLVVWAAIAQVVAIDIGLEADSTVCLEVAAVLCRKSGVFSALRIA